MKIILLFFLLIPSFSVASKYQHQFSNFVCKFEENNSDSYFKIEIYDFEYQKNFDDELFSKDINKNLGVYSGNMINNSCKYDTDRFTNLNCWTSVGYDLINIFLPYNGRRHASLITIFPDESALIYKTKNSNVPFDKFKDKNNLSKGFSQEFEFFALGSLNTGACIGTNK